MNAFTTSAPGKVILFGEHAVVYGRPALAAPVQGLRATAVFEPGGPLLHIEAPQLGLSLTPESAPEHPLSVAVRLLTEHLRAGELTGRITLTSAIPPASGLGSGAAATAALMRAVAGAAGEQIEPDVLSSLVFEVEKLYHGTPSGLDNTVICYEQPIYFVKGQPPGRITFGAPLTLVIGSTGIPSPTLKAVQGVRERWQADQQHYDALFDAVAEVVHQASTLTAAGDTSRLGPLLIENHRLLREIGVSSAELNKLVEAALEAGAAGAKLSGGGQGGNMIALVEAHQAEQVAQALRAAGAAETHITQVE